MRHSAFTAIGLGLIGVVVGVILFAIFSNRRELCETCGKLTYKGVPISAGIILFQTEASACAGSIAPDGTYLVVMPRGAYRVAIVTGAAQAAPGAVDVPAKYADPQTSGLVYEVKGRKSMFDIDLAD